MSEDQDTEAERLAENLVAIATHAAIEIVEPLTSAIEALDLLKHKGPAQRAMVHLVLWAKAIRQLPAEHQEMAVEGGVQGIPHLLKALAENDGSTRQ